MEQWTSKCGSRIRGIARLSTLWSPFDRRLALAGVRVKTLDANASSTDEAFAAARGGRQIGEALASCWKETFATSKSIDTDYAKQHLERWGVKYDFSSCKPPSARSYQMFLDLARHSATGPDGIPHAAWQNTVGEGAVSLFFWGRKLRQDCTLH